MLRRKKFHSPYIDSEDRQRLDCTFLYTVHGCPKHTNKKFVNKINSTFKKLGAKLYGMRKVKV